MGAIVTVRVDPSSTDLIKLKQVLQTELNKQTGEHVVVTLNVRQDTYKQAIDDKNISSSHYIK